MRAIVLLTVLLLAPLTDALAQEQPLQPGQRVRVTVGGLSTDKHEDTFRELRGDTLVLDSVRYRLADLSRLDLYRGSKSNAGTGALMGGVLTGALGLLLGVAYAVGEDWEGIGVGGMLKVTVVFAAPGAAIGALIGSASKTDKWEEVPLDRLQVGVVPTRRGFGIGARIAF
jgi:hypothetical protein